MQDKKKKPKPIKPILIPIDGKIDVWVPAAPYDKTKPFWWNCC